MHYIAQSDSLEYPDHQDLISTVCRNFSALHITYIADLIADAARRQVDCNNVVEMLVSRLKSERTTCHPEELVAVAQLCGELAGRHGSSDLSSLVLTMALERKKSMRPESFCEAMWGIRAFFAMNPRWLMQLPEESFCLNIVAGSTTPESAFRLLTVCAAKLTSQSAAWANSAMRRAWQSRQNNYRAFDAFLAFLHLAEAFPPRQAQQFAETFVFCLKSINEDSVDADIVVAIVKGLAHVCPESSVLVERYVSSCLTKLDKVDHSQLQSLLVALCQEFSGKFKLRTLQMLSKLLNSMDEAVIGDEQLAALCCALLQIRVVDSDILTYLAVHVSRSVANWSSKNSQWGTVANLLFHSCFLHEQLSKCAITQLSSFERPELVSTGGIMYWLWSAAVQDIELPPKLLCLLRENPRSPEFLKDFTVFLYHENQWLQQMPCLPFYYPLDRHVLGQSKAFSEEIVGAFGQRVCPISVRLPVSRPLFFAAFLLDEKRRMVSWSKHEILPSQVNKRLLAERNLHALAVAADSDAAKVTQKSFLRNIDHYVWRHSLTARGWQVSVLPGAAHESRTRLSLRQLVCKVANIR